MRNRPSLGAVMIVALTMLGCPPAPSRRAVRADPRSGAAGPGTAPTPQAQHDFDAAFDLFAQSRWADAATGFAAVVARYPTSSLLAEARYRWGVCLNRLGRHDEARTVLREFLERFPTSAYSRQASVELGLAESRLGNKQDAEQILRPVMKDLSASERQEVASALAEAIRSGSATIEAVRQAAKRAADGEPGAQAELLRLVDTQASFIDVATLYADGPGSAAFALVAAKMARIYAHLGDVERAREAAKAALDAGAGGKGDRVQEVLDRLALRDNVKPNVVGVILPLSGRFKNYGEAIQDGVGLAISKKDGVEVVYKDSQGDPDLAAQAVEQLVREGAVVIVGPVGTSEAAPAAVRAQELGVTMISLSRAEGVTSLGPWIFRNSLTNSQQGRALARYASEVLGTKSTAVFAPNIPSGDEVTGAFWDAFEAAGGEVKGYETYDHDQTTFSRPIKKLVARDNLESRPDFRAEAQKIAAAEKNPYKRRRLLEKLAGQQPPVVDFDALLIPDYYKTVGLIAPALAVEDIITNGCDEKALESIRKTQKRDDIRPVTLLGTAGWNSPELVTRGGRYVLCSVFVDGFFASSHREATRKFVDDFQEQYQRRPGLLEAQGFDTGRIVRDLVQRQHPPTREAFRAALANVRRFPGATGDTTFGPDREADKPLFFLTVDKSGITELDVKISPAGLAAPPKGSGK